MWSVTSSSFRKRHQGRTIYIVGSSEALDELPDDWPKDKITIGLNESFLRFDHILSYIHVTERSVLQWILTNRREVEHHLILSDPLYPPSNEEIECMGERVAVEYGKSFNERLLAEVIAGVNHCVAGHGSVLHTAMMIAAMMGASNIETVGCGDGVSYCKAVAKMKAETQVLKSKEEWKDKLDNRIEIGTAIVTQSLIKAGIDVHREGSDSFIITSYYTSKYKESAEDLRKQCHDLGLTCDIQQLPEFNTWQHATYYKPHFLSRMLSKHKGKNVVWVDADAYIAMYPKLFLYAKADFMARVIDWGARKQLAAGTLFLRNCETVRDMIRTWCLSQLYGDKTMLEQEHLQAVVENGDYSFEKMPASYCYIPSLSARTGEKVNAVIAHKQFSRMTRGAMESEQQKYTDMWEMPEYRKSSPGLRTVGHLIEYAGLIKETSILDVGCGSGQADKVLQQLGFDVTMVDLAANCLNPDVDATKFIVAPADQIPLQEKFGIVYCCDMLEHLPPNKIDATLRELQRLGRQVFLRIACYPDSREEVQLHLSIKKPEAWVETLQHYFKLTRWKVETVHEQGLPSLLTYGSCR